MKSKLIHGKGFAGRDGTNRLIGQTCEICLDQFQDNDVVTYVRRCMHVFHWACFERLIASKVGNDRTVARRIRRSEHHVDISCPNHREGEIDNEGCYNFGIISTGRLQQLGPEAKHPYTFGWSYQHYCPSAEGVRQHRFNSVLNQQTIDSFKERAGLNANMIISATRDGRLHHGDGTSLLHYFERLDIITAERFFEQINRCMRCLNRPFVSPYDSLQNFWGWVLHNLDVLTIPDGGDDRYYRNMVQQVFEGVPQRPYYELIQIRQYTSGDFDEFTRLILHSPQWHLFMSTVLLLMLTSDRMVPSLFPLLTQLNNALASRNLELVRTLCAQIATHTDNRG